MCHLADYLLFYPVSQRNVPQDTNYAERERFSVYDECLAEMAAA